MTEKIVKNIFFVFQYILFLFWKTRGIFVRIPCEISRILTEGKVLGPTGARVMTILFLKTVCF